jgi:DNA primase
MSVFEEIRRRLDIVDVISEYLPLKRVGSNYATNCPFHPDRTPSFYVSPSRQMWKCFGCGKGGDVIAFVAEYENLSYAEAARLLAERYNLNIDFGKQDQEEKNRYLYALKRISKFYEEHLREVKEAKHYLLKERKLSAQTVVDFNLGFAGDGFKSVAFARKEDIFQPLLELKHFYQTSEGRYKDFFYQRITIPIRNSQGKIVAFGGRAIKDSLTPKYKNSPNSIVFQKEKTLFALDRARKAAREKERLILVEGYFDVIRLHSVGFRETVAPLGTSLTIHQARLIARTTSNVYLLFDGDTAGRKAAFSAAKNLLRFSLNVYVAFLPAGADPDTYVLQEGIKGLKNILSEARLIQEFLIEKVQEADLQGKEKLAHLYKELVDNIPDPIKRELWYKEFRNRTGLSLTKKGKVYFSGKPTVGEKELNPSEVEFLLGLFHLGEKVNLEDFKLSPKAKELAEIILSENGKEKLPRWLLEADTTDLKRRFELAKVKLSIEKSLMEETFKTLYQLEKKIKEGQATREEVENFCRLLGSVNKKLYQLYKKKLESSQ